VTAEAVSSAPEDFVGLRLPEIAGSIRAEPIEACARAALGGECTELEMPGYEDPTQLWSLTFVPVVDAAGAVGGGMVLCREITEQRRAEQLLRASQRRLAEAQRIAQIGSWEWEVASDELAISEEMAHITDRRRADAECRRLLGRVYEAQEGQDRRLAADLHDGHVQSLATIGFKLEQARLRLGASGSPEVDELLWQVTKDLSTEVTSLRRASGRLRPLVLVEDGLDAALREEAKSACNRAALVAMRERVEALGGRFGVTTAPGRGTVIEAWLPLTDPTERWGA